MDWTAFGAIGSFGLFVIASVGLLLQLRETRKAKSQSSELARRAVEAAPDVEELKEGLTELRMRAEAAGASESFQEKLGEFETRLDRLQDWIWSAMAVTIDAGHRPIVGAGMMKRHVPGLGRNPGEFGHFVVDVALLAKTLRNGPEPVASLNEKPGGVWPNLASAVESAEEQGIVKRIQGSDGELIGLTEKGRALASILAAQERLTPEQVRLSTEPTA